MIYDRLYHFPQEQSSSWIVEKITISISLPFSLQSEKSRIKEHARDLVSRQNRLRRDQRRINDYCSPSISRKNPSPSSWSFSRSHRLLHDAISFYERHTPALLSPSPGECGRKGKKGKREKVSGGNSIWDEIKPRFRLRERSHECPSVGNDSGRNKIALRLVKKCTHRHRGRRESTKGKSHEVGM